MAYLDLHNVGGHIDFIRIVKMSILNKANTESQIAINETNEILVEKRRALALSIFQNTDNQARYFSFHVASQGGSAISVVDGELYYPSIANIDNAIDSIIESIYDIRAGITPEELI